MLSFRLGILGSGKGSNCRAIIEACRAGIVQATVGVVVSDVFDAGILDVAREFAIPNIYLPPGKFRTKLEPAIEEQLVQILREAGVDLVVLAGFMRILKPTVLDAFPKRVVNIHPSLLPKYPGTEAWRQALEAGEHVTGCTVHYVDAGIDTGEIIAQREVPVLAGDTPESLHARIQLAERELYPRTIQELVAAASR